MDGSLSWQASLARKNINILNIDLNNQIWFYEFMYHPKPGQTKWSKTFFENPYEEIKQGKTVIRKYQYSSPSQIAKVIMDEVLGLRKELEG